MKPLLSLLLALFGAVCCLGAQLSTDTLPSPATIDSLQARIDHLERRADRWDRLRSRLPEFRAMSSWDTNTTEIPRVS